MAEPVTATPNDALVEMLECAVCLNPVLDHRVLPCMHNFCLSCLEPLVTEQQLTCPVCRTISSIPEEGVQTLPRNPLLVSILDQFCESCRRRRREIRCEHCGKHMCLVCNAACKDESIGKLHIETGEVVTMACDTLCQIHQNIDDINTQMFKISDAIDQTTDSMIETIRMRQRELKQNLRMKGRTSIHMLNEQYRKLSDQLGKLNSFSVHIDKAEGSLDLGKSDEWKEVITNTEYISKQRHWIQLEYNENNKNTQAMTGTYGEIYIKRDIFKEHLTVSKVATPLENHPHIDYRQVAGPREMFGTKGNNRGQFQLPTRVAISPVSGNIFVCDHHDNKIKIFNDIGQFEYSKSKKKTHICLGCEGGVVVTNQGVVVVADTHNNRLQTFTEQGQFIRDIGQSGSGPGQFKSPEGLACDESGRIYVCDHLNKRIQVVKQDGTFVREFGNETDNACWQPRAIAVSPNGDVVVADITGTVQLFTRHGQPKATLRYDNEQHPSDVAVDRDGNILVTDSWSHQVYVMTPRGEFIKRWGSKGEKCGQLTHPSGITCTADGRVVVVDGSNYRVQIF